MVDQQLGIQCLTGNSVGFYPTYQVEDPYAAKDRGYYFRGTSVVTLPPHATVSSLSLILAS